MAILAVQAATPRIPRLDRSQVSPEVGEIYALSAIRPFDYCNRWNDALRMQPTK